MQAQVNGKQRCPSLLCPESRSTPSRVTSLRCWGSQGWGAEPLAPTDAPPAARPHMKCLLLCFLVDNGEASPRWFSRVGIKQGEKVPNQYCSMLMSKWFGLFPYQAKPWKYLGMKHGQRLYVTNNRQADTARAKQMRAQSTTLLLPASPEGKGAIVHTGHWAVVPCNLKLGKKM